MSGESGCSLGRISREYRILPNHSAFFDILSEADERARSMKLQSIELCIEDDPTQDGIQSLSSTKLTQLDTSWRSHIPELLQKLAEGIYIEKKHLKMKGSLGEGGFAIVEKMEMQLEMGMAKEMVAVKKLKPGVIQDDDDLKELVQESNLLRRVRHKGIVEFKGIGCFNESSVNAMRSSIFLAEEFMAGGSLKNLIMDQMRSERARLYWMDDAWRWLLQMAEALAYLHSCSPAVVHRDVKPENVLMSSKDWNMAVAKIADFGLHKRINRVHQLKREKSSQFMECVLDSPEASSELEREQPRLESANIDIPISSKTPEQTDLSCYSLDMPSHFRIIKKSSSLSGVQRDSLLWMVPEDSPLIDSDIGYCHLTSAYSVPQAFVTEDFSPIHLINPKPSSNQGSSLPDVADQRQKDVHSDGDDSSASLETHPASEKRIRGGQLMGWMQNTSDNIVSSKTKIPVALEQSPFKQTVDPLSWHFLFEPDSQTKHKSDLTENKQHGSHQVLNQLNKLHQERPKKLKEIKKQKPGRISSRYALGLSGTEAISGIVGSLLYMAPEVYKGKHYDETVDVFGFGVIMYELLMSELVLVRVLMQAQRPSDMQSMLRKYAKSVAKGHREDIPYYWPQEVQNLIRGCWHQRPDHRPKMTDIVQKLKELKEAGCFMEMDKRLARRIRRDPVCCSCCIVA